MLVNSQMLTYRILRIFDLKQRQINVPFVICLTKPYTLVNEYEIAKKNLTNIYTSSKTDGIFSSYFYRC